MAEPTWGLLSKSGVDAETVEQAIARLITAHEADETAHLGAGESLETHKASDVIDHVIGSVVADKLTMTELNEYWDYSHLKADASIFGTISYGATFLAFYRSATFGTEIDVNIPGPMTYNNYTLTKSFLIDFVTRYHVFTGPDDSTGFFGFILHMQDETETDFTFPGVGFLSVNGSVCAVVKGCSDIGDDATYETLYQSSAFTFSGSDLAHLRIQYTASTHTFDFYMNGVQVGTYVFDTAYLSAGSVGDTPGFYSPVITTTKNIVFNLYQMNSVVSLQ